MREKELLKTTEHVEPCAQVFLQLLVLPQPKMADRCHKANKKKKNKRKKKWCAGLCDQVKTQAASAVSCFCLSDCPHALRGSISLTRPPEIISGNGSWQSEGSKRVAGNGVCPLRCDNMDLCCFPLPWSCRQRHLVSSHSRSSATACRGFGHISLTR